MTEYSSTETDVLIVGAGPVGLSLAIELRRRDIDCRLIERNDSTAETTRALVVNPRTLQIFEDMGILEEVMDTGIIMGRMSMHLSDEQQVDVNLALPFRYPYPLDIPQYQTENILIDRLEELGGEVEFQRELTGFGQNDDTVTATVDHVDGSDRIERISADWLVGCDGGHSCVRNTLGLKLEGTTLPGLWIVADMVVDWSKWDDQDNDVGAWSHPDGDIQMLRMPDEEWRLIAKFYSDPDPKWTDPSKEQLQQLIRERTGDQGAMIREISWISSFRLNQRMVSRYRNGHVFLAGDAAHIHIPLGGFGMNTGIQDVYNLGWKLAAVIDGKAPETLLDTYEQERIPVAKTVLEGTTQTHSAIELSLMDNPIMKPLRNAGMKHLVTNEAFLKWFIRLDTQLDIAYPESPLSGSRIESGLADILESPSWRTSVRRARNAWSAPKAGERALDGRCRHLDGTETSLYQELHKQTEFVLLLFTGTESSDSIDVTTLAKEVTKQAGDNVISYIVISEEREPTQKHLETPVLLDDGNVLHDVYGVVRSSIVLIRPDDYIGFRARPARLEPLFAYLDDWLELSSSFHSSEATPMEVSQ